MERSKILPAILYPRLVSDRTHSIYSHDLGRHMVRKEVLEPGEHPVTLPMLEDIAVQFVQDREQGFEWVRERDMWTDMDLIQQAFRNLKENLGESMDLVSLENGLVRIVSGGKYEASFLLLGNLWGQLEGEYGAELYAAVPSYNALLIGRQDHRRAILEMQGMIRGVFFEADPESLLSKAVYQRVEGEWRIVATAF